MAGGDTEAPIASTAKTAGHALNRGPDWIITRRVRVNERDIQSLAESVVRGLRGREFVKLKAPEQVIVDTIVRLLIDNLKEEAAIEEEAERLAEKHLRQAPGLDSRKIISGFKERIARDRGFTL